jgi:hypothetical protein
MFSSLYSESSSKSQPFSLPFGACHRGGSLYYG